MPKRHSFSLPSGAAAALQVELLGRIATICQNGLTCDPPSICGQKPDDGGDILNLSQLVAHALRFVGDRIGSSRWAPLRRRQRSSWLRVRTRPFIYVTLQPAGV